MLIMTLKIMIVALVVLGILVQFVSTDEEENNA